jgi:predicted metal-binding membrane protein
MLVAFALGMTHLALMAGFTALMAYEKMGLHGVLVAKAAGLGLLAAAVAVAAHL